MVAGGEAHRCSEGSAKRFPHLGGKLGPTVRHNVPWNPVETAAAGDPRELDEMTSYGRTGRLQPRFWCPGS